MAYLTKQQVLEIIKNAPIGTNPVGIVAIVPDQITITPVSNAPPADGVYASKPLSPALRRTDCPAAKLKLLDIAPNLPAIYPPSKP